MASQAADLQLFLYPEKIVAQVNFDRLAGKGLLRRILAERFIVVSGAGSKAD
jgi:hypothetical protein